MKPHIELIEEGLWMCSSGESPGGIRLGFGDSPYSAWLDWLLGVNSEKVYDQLTSGGHIDLGIQSNEFWDMCEG